MSTPAQPAADKASPRPWRYGLVPEDAQNRHFQESPRSGDRYFIGPESSGSDICEVHHTYERGDSGTSEANAQLIVRSVNQAAAVDALCDALADIVGEELSGESNLGFVKDDDCIHPFVVTFGMLRRARAALKAVEELKGEASHE